MPPDHRKAGIAARPRAGQQSTPRTRRPLTKSSCIRRSGRSFPGALTKPRSGHRAPAPARRRAAAAISGLRPKTIARRSRSCSVGRHHPNLFSVVTQRESDPRIGNAKLDSHEEMRLNSALGARRYSRRTGTFQRSTHPNLRAHRRRGRLADTTSSLARSTRAPIGRPGSRETISRFETAAIEAKPSPRKPSVAIDSNSRRDAEFAGRMASNRQSTICAAGYRRRYR